MLKCQDGAIYTGVTDDIIGKNYVVVETENRQEVKNGALEAPAGGVFETTPQAFCVKIAD